jgi:hypothetical protein
MLFQEEHCRWPGPAGGSTTALSPLAQKAVFNFYMNLVEPLLRTLGSILVRVDFSL